MNAGYHSHGMSELDNVNDLEWIISYHEPLNISGSLIGI